MSSTPEGIGFVASQWSMATRKRRANVFALSLLDVMAGGFGAVVVLFLIINHATEETTEQNTRELLAESRLLDFREEAELKDLASVQQLIDELRNRIKQVKTRLRAVNQDIADRNEDLDDVELIDEKEHEELERLKAQIESQREELEVLLAIKIEESERQAAIEVEGEGDRQYVTDMRLGGRYILIALDASASMLDDTIVNVIRRRNMPKEVKLRSPKWQRALDTVNWLVANVPLDARLQIVTFNEESEILGNEGKWVEAGDSDEIYRLLDSLNDLEPEGGTNLYNLMMEIRKLQPMTDNMFLIIDSLPTQGKRKQRGNYVTGRERSSLFLAAMAELPPALRVNVILFPMEGDLYAAGYYWQLAAKTGGTFLSPSRDWP